MATNPDWATLLAAHHESLVQEYVAANPRSQEAFYDAQLVLPGGNTRSVLNATPFPLSVESARDAFVTSVDGTEYLDFVSDFSAGLFGHSHPTIFQAFEGALKSGFSLGAVTRKEAELARRIQARFSSIDRVRFCNSGTEANMYAIAAAMAFTKRSKVTTYIRNLSLLLSFTLD
jgi:glutamate-1-semialdehyde 2,1-aminomutase